MDIFETPQFNDNGTMEVDTLDVIQADLIPPGSVTLQCPDISSDPQDMHEALAIVNDGWKIVEDYPTGQQFEVVACNTDQSSPNDLDLKVFLTTWMGSIGGNAIASKGNPGNAYELALDILAHPDDAIVYVGGLGNGGTSSLLPNEARFFREHGYLPEQAPTLRALGRVLLDIGQPRKFSANSSGGRVAMGVAANLPSSVNVTHLYSKGTPGISEITAKDLLQWRKVVKQSEAQDRPSSVDPWEVTEERSEQARQALTKVYSKEAAEAVKQSKLDFISARITDILGYRHGGQLPNAMAVDLNRALERQPNLLATLHISLGDFLYPRKKDIANVLALIATSENHRQRSVTALFTTGRHLDHSHNPSYRIAAEDWALNRNQ